MRLASLFATDEGVWNAVFALHHLWLLPRHRSFVRVSARVDPAHPRFPSIAAKHPSANWFEREVMDYFGLVPEGHPNPYRVACTTIGRTGSGRCARTSTTGRCHAWAGSRTRIVR